MLLRLLRSIFLLYSRSKNGRPSIPAQQIEETLSEDRNRCRQRCEGISCVSVQVPNLRQLSVSARLWLSYPSGR